MKIENNYTLRDRILKDDPENVKKIVSSTNFFNEEEIKIAVELAEESLNKGVESGYRFLFLEIQNVTVGYSCFGLIPATKFSYDLYWISVYKDYQNLGLGKVLLQESEKAIKKLGGKRIFVETSGRKEYESTRKFYSKCNYSIEAVLKDFYDIGDDKYIYSK